MRFNFLKLNLFLYKPLLLFNNLSYNIIIRGDNMFKLDNRGWGLGVLLAFLVLFFIAIVLISIGASNLGI